MKKLTVFILSLCMLFSGCRVGPKEELPSPVTGDIPAETLPAATEPQPETATESETVEPVTEFSDTESSEKPQDSREEPDENDENDEEDGEPEITDEYNGIMYAVMSLNVRSGPSTDYERIGHLNEGEAAEVVGYADEYGWYLIKFNGGVGYVSGSYMTEIEPEKNYPPLENDYAVLQSIANAAAKAFADPEASVTGYLGSYEAGEAVRIKTAEGEDVYIYDGEEFTDIDSAYDGGMIDGSDSEAIEYYAEASEETDIRPESENAAPYPLPDGISSELAEEIRSCCGEGAEEMIIAGYYGECSAGIAVALCDSSTYSADLKPVTVGNYTFTLASGSFDLYLYSNGELTLLTEAYENGRISEGDLKELKYDPEDPENASDEAPYPPLEPLDGATESRICEDYAKAKNLSKDEVYIVRYFGSARAGQAVIMWRYDPSMPDVGLPVTDDEKLVTIGGYTFSLASGSYEIEFHRNDGGFMTLKTAYERGYVSEEDIKMMNYYSELRPGGE